MSPHYPFCAIIISHLPSDPVDRMARRSNLVKTLEWWKSNTSMPITIVASNWLPMDDHAVDFAVGLSDVRMLHHPAQPVAVNRAVAFEALYASQHDWGVMLDDDAILYDKPQHNLGPALFPQMVANGLSTYDGVDIFFPINPQKRPGQAAIWATNPALYTGHHVFDRNMDLKGSMFVVRNFRKEGKREVLPDSKFLHVGEDRQIALEAVSIGYTVMRSGNMVLNELRGPSHFGSPITRPARMIPGYTALATRYAGLGLKINPVTHQHVFDDFYRTCWRTKPTQVAV